MFCSQNPATVTPAQVEERLQLYVDERVEALRSEILALLESDGDRRGIIGDASSPRNTDRVEVKVTKESGPAEEPGVLVVSQDHLDQHDVHALQESIWDCAVLIGFDCIGLGESSTVLLLIGLNIFVQLYFCYIIYNFGGMLDQPLQNEKLDGLLRFRTGVAHRIENADLVSGRSLLSQVCEGDERLHVSGTQLDLYEDLASFKGTGMWLCLLALLCWGASSLRELDATARFTRAIFQRRGKSTRIVVRAQEDGGLVLESLGPFDLVKVVLLGIVPRLTTAVLLCVVGILYLSRTSRLEDLLLNAMALAFIMDVDELFYTAFVPHRVRSLVTGLAPMHLIPVHGLRRQWFQRCSKVLGGCLDSLARLVVLVCAISIIYWMELIPFHGRLQQAMDILCSGEQNFVYSINPASGMVVASRAAEANESWAAAECAVLQVAHPKLREEYGWSPPRAHCSDIPDMTQLSAQNAPVLLRPSWVKTLDDEEAKFERGNLDYVGGLAKASVQQAALNAACSDQVNPWISGSDVYLAALQSAVGGGVAVSGCEDVKPLCYLLNMTRVRALCPVTCECNLWGFTAAGFFKTTHYGCPAQCQVESETTEQGWTSNGIYPLDCVDFTRTRYFQPPGTSWHAHEQFRVMDLDQDGNITYRELIMGSLRHVIDKYFWEDVFQFDLNDDEVWDVAEQASFEEVWGYYDLYDSDGDDVLSAAEASVIMGSSGYVDVDGDGILSLAEMAWHPRWPDVVAPPPPEKITAEVERGASDYFEGLYEHLWGRPNFVENMELAVHVLGDRMGLLPAQEKLVVEHLASGEAAEEWSRGRWQLGPDIPHPRGLVWCDFIVSWEVVLLLGLNACNADNVASLRTMCPQACHCQARMRDCPSSCPDLNRVVNALDSR